MNRCEKCTHNEVCKYKDDYQKYLESIKKEDDSKLDDFLVVECRCKYFQDNPYVDMFGNHYKGISMTVPNDEIRTQLTSDSNDCKNCLNYHYLINPNATTIGDIPCNFCSKMNTTTITLNEKGSN